MKVLGLDTATLSAGIAIVEDTRVLAETRHDSSRRTADLLVAVDDVCRRACVAPTELDAVAIGAGPGSFTGLRIGMATAKGIAFAAGRPLWAVSSLAALAHDGVHELAHADGALEPPVKTIVAVLDARRGEVYAGCYRQGSLLGEERVLAPSELGAWIAQLAGDAELAFVGDALAAHREVLAPFADRWLAVSTPSGTAVAQLALAGPRLDVLTGGAPTYIRPSEAEIKYPDGVPGALPRTR